MENKREKGAKGEQFASNFLEKNGYKVIKKNFNFSRFGEIDIVCEKDNLLVFVEVRSKQNPNTPDPINSINFGKQKNFRKAAEGYIYINKIENKDCRIDVIIVDFTVEPVNLLHLENAF
jgi:putative endonuclease